MGTAHIQTDYHKTPRCPHANGNLLKIAGFMLNQKTVQCQCFTGNAGRFALKALAPQGLLADISLAFVCNSEEEIGSGSSRELIRREARRSAFAFVLECGGLNGEIVTGRKGEISQSTLMSRDRPGVLPMPVPTRAPPFWNWPARPLPLNRSMIRKTA